MGPLRRRYCVPHQRPQRRLALARLLTGQLLGDDAVPALEVPFRPVAGKARGGLVDGEGTEPVEIGGVTLAKPAKKKVRAAGHRIKRAVVRDELKDVRSELNAASKAKVKKVYLIDLVGATDITITFRYAYAQRNAANDDVLRVYVSGNCGDLWSLRKVMHGNASLLTAGVVPGDFVPTGPEEWGLVTMTNISPSLHTSSFRIRFEFESDGGNNLYIDDINILDGSVGMDDQGATGSGFRVWPTPASDRAQAEVDVKDGGLLTLEILDPLGALVRMVAERSVPPGLHRFELPLSGLAPGLYFVRERIGPQQEVVRLVVEK